MYKIEFTAAYLCQKKILHYKIMEIIGAEIELIGPKNASAIFVNTYFTEIGIII